MHLTFGSAVTDERDNQEHPIGTHDRERLAGTSSPDCRRWARQAVSEIAACSVPFTRIAYCGTDMKHVGTRQSVDREESIEGSSQLSRVTLHTPSIGDEGKVDALQIFQPRP
jgi:hypothetical protein